MELKSETEGGKAGVRPSQSSLVSKRLRRLLLDLEKEVGNLSQENAALRKEIDEKHSSDGGSTVQGASFYGSTPSGPRPSLMLPMPKPDNALELPPSDAGLSKGYFSGGTGGPRSSIQRPQLAATPNSTQLDEGQLALPGSMRPYPPPTSQTRQWQQQFDRLRKESEQLSSYDLWVTVSRQEHQFYGHSKHPLRTVVRTVRLIRQHYGKGRMTGFSDDLLRSTTLTGGMRATALAVRSTTTNAFFTGGASDDFHSHDGEDDRESFRSITPPSEMALDWETFQAFMSDDVCRISEEEGGNAEYLRKALRAESNEYFTEEARREIAQRQEDEVDPMPFGWRMVILETLPPPIIMVNAICLGLQSDIQPNSFVWDALEFFFLAFYLMEISLKGCFLGCRRFFRGMDAGWNIFDLACIVVSVVDLIYKQFIVDPEKAFSMLKFFRLLRFARLARIIKSFKSHYFDDLKTMSLGILSGAKVLLWAVVLFFACVFVLGVIMKETVGHNDESEELRNVPSAMFSVFRCLIGDCSSYNGTPLNEKMRMAYGARFMIPYILIFLVVNFGLFNLIVAVFIDRVVSISIKAKQKDLGKREREMRAAIEEMLVTLTRGFTEQSKSSCRPRLSTGSVMNKSLGSRFSYSKARQAAANEQRYHAIAEAMQQLRNEQMQITRELFSTWLTDPEVLEFLENLEIDTSTKMEIFDVCDVDKSGSLTCDELVNGLMRLRGPISKCDVIAIRLKVRYLTKILEDIHHMMAA